METASICPGFRYREDVPPDRRLPRRSRSTILWRILWRYNLTDKIIEYQLNTITYGLACAPFVVIRTLRQFADDEKGRFLLGAEVLRRDVYMNDVLMGAPSLDEAREMRSQLIQLCYGGRLPS